MIDPSNGSLIITVPRITLVRDMALEMLLRFPVDGVQRSLNEHTFWRSYTLRSILIEEEAFAAQLYFYNGQLSLITFSSTREEFGTSWTDWSEELEGRRKKFHDEWLASTLQGRGEPYLFSWGEIASLYESKGGGSCIVISYLPSTIGSLYKGQISGA